jgi:hyperosmotically inducible protein
MKGVDDMKEVLKVMLSACVVACWLTIASPPAVGQNASAPAPDNTKTNQRDKSRTEPTADQQKENQSDREIARQIRRSIVQDKSLSSYAHNVKVISQDGMVTLKGPVRSDEEKTTVEAKAAEVAGKDKVSSQLEVKPKQ